jgi:hypothetical protein
MGIILILSFYAVVIFLVVYLWFFADTESKSFDGSFARFFLQTIPKHFSKTFRAVFGNKIAGYCGSVFHYVVYEPNPILLLLYLFIINTAFICWLLFGVQFLPNNPEGDFHYYFALFGVIASQITFYLACTTPPGQLTEETVTCFGHQPYDGLMYISRMYCRTCRLPKVRERETRFNFHYICLTVFSC